MRLPTGQLIASVAKMVFAGSPEDVAERILQLHEQLGHTRQIFQMGVCGMPHAPFHKSIELRGAKFLPAIRRQLGMPIGSPSSRGRPFDRCTRWRKKLIMLLRQSYRFNYRQWRMNEHPSYP